jgi:protein-disulfide isomerase
VSEAHVAASAPLRHVLITFPNLETKMNRRSFLNVVSTIPVALVALSVFRTRALGQGSIPFDPEAPIGGNPKGDVTIIAFLDYNCPFCKKSAPDLARIVQTDGHVRLIYKDWPILAESSGYGAQHALGAKYQGKYEAVHNALMGIPGHGISKEKMLEAVKASGVDLARLQADLDANMAEIMALLKRNLAQADALGFQGTPTYIVGPFVASTLDYDGFKQMVSDARARDKH